MNIKNHWLQDAKRVASPNFDARPEGCLVDTVVVHNISLPPGQFGGGHVDELFTNCLDADAHPYFAEVCHLEVSAHVMIDRSGCVTQYVAFDQRAWHAGKSSYQGRERFNDFSIGIELEGADDVPFESVQYIVLAKIITALNSEFQRNYPHQNTDHMAIVGHSTISPDRKTDPGPLFDWEKLHQLVSFTGIL